MLAGSRDNWNRVAHYLTTNYHVIIPDLPGSGETIVSHDFDYSVPNLAEKLRRFVEAANLKATNSYCWALTRRIYCPTLCWTISI